MDFNVPPPKYRPQGKNPPEAEATLLALGILSILTLVGLGCGVLYIIVCGIKKMLGLM